MNADAYFETGSGKALCQDYAIAGVHKSLAYAIGSDGCSSSPDTDVGARLLCLAARSACLPMWEDNNPESKIGSKLVENLVVSRCKDLYKQLNVPVSMFDATLWIALWPDEGDVVVMGWGDGVVIADYETNRLFVEHKYLSNAPLYLSYDILRIRKYAHQEQFGNEKSIISEWLIETDFSPKKILETQVDWGQPFIRTFDRKGLWSLSICSDGIHTYMDDKNVSLPTWKLAFEFSAYKSTKGEFVKRRMRRISKDHKIFGFHHYDDVFCSAIARSA